MRVTRTIRDATAQKQLTFSYNETITGVKPEISDELTHERSIVRNEMQSLVEDKLKNHRTFQIQKKATSFPPHNFQEG